MIRLTNGGTAVILKSIGGLLSILIVAGCSHIDNGFSLSDESAPGQAKSFQQGYFTSSKRLVSNHNLEFYTRDIVSEMSLNMKSIDANGVIAISNFANASSDYESIDELGFALGESFLRELHQFGFNTLDFKVSDAIRVTPKGDFALTRDFMELKNEIPADYVLVGTLTEHHRGFTVNARIVDLSSKAILATGKSFIPLSTVNMLVAHRMHPQYK